MSFRSLATAALTLGLCVAAPGPAKASQAFAVVDITLAPNGNDLGYGAYPNPTASNGPQCEGLFIVGSDTLATINSVVVHGESVPRPEAVVVHRPGNPGSPKGAGGTPGNWNMITHEHDGSYVPQGTWVVILPKYENRSCADTYQGKVTVTLAGL